MLEELDPGTVHSAFSAPFNSAARPAADATADLLRVLGGCRWKKRGLLRLQRRQAAMVMAWWIAMILILTVQYQ